MQYADHTKNITISSSLSNIMVSARKKKEKKKDFQKTKLKVGKTAPKSNTHTDLSFKAKTISLPNQSIVKGITGAGGVPVGSTVSPLNNEDFKHHILLLKHHSAGTRKEALIYLTNAWNKYLASSDDLGVNIKPIVDAAAPLVLDLSEKVRAELLLLLRALCFEPGQVDPVPANQLSDISRPKFTLKPEFYTANSPLSLHIPNLALYIHSAMTHITPDIRADSTKFLLLMVTPATGESHTFSHSFDLSICSVLQRQYWAKTLNCFFALFGWSHEKTDQQLTMSSSSVTAGLAFGKQAASVKKSFLECLQLFLRSGLSEFGVKYKEIKLLDASGNDVVIEQRQPENPLFHPMSRLFTQPPNSDPFLHLNLFKSTNTSATTTSITEDVEARNQVLKTYLGSLHHGLELLAKEGGEIGRLAKKTIEVSVC
ncbi:Rix1 complex component [Yarrowia lipolytica]|nr:Rix1 complex component [Yarrowia lipolytica]RDW52100.1 Rix1 complex component [Yarrowia lipolytica]